MTLNIVTAVCLVDVLIDDSQRCRRRLCVPLLLLKQQSEYTCSLPTETGISPRKRPPRQAALSVGMRFAQAGLFSTKKG